MDQTETYIAIPIAPQIRSRLEGVCVLGARLSLQRIPGQNADFWNDWSRLHQTWKGKSRKAVENDWHVKAYRSFYSSMGLDSDHNPPSVQVLVQRFLREDILSKVPLIHPIVDAVNVAAVETMVPLGVFDAGSISGNIMIDVCRDGEYFHAIGSKSAIQLKAGLIVLRDNDKVLSQFCSRDSEAQKVTEFTQEIWLLGCQVPGITVEEVAQALSKAIEYIGRHYVVQPCWDETGR